MDSQLTKEDLRDLRLEQEPLDVFDLPQIHTQPSAKVLLDTLSLLSVESRSWEVTPSATPGRGTPRVISGVSTPVRQPKRKIRSEGVPQYLTKIVSSRLAWIPNEEDKEQIWDTASVRLSERSGRTARGAFTRPFLVPALSSQQADKGALSPDTDATQELIDISIHEPALTADNLGLKTWASSYVLACKWETLLARVPTINTCRSTSGAGGLLLELGAGTGLVGIAAAAVLGARVLLTDLPEITDNLAKNVHTNHASIADSHGTTSVAILDWTQPGQIIHVGGQTQMCPLPGQSANATVIVAADPIYSMDHPPLLVNAIKYHLSREANAVVVIGLPLRESYTAERLELRTQLAGMGLKLLFEETDFGADDWGEEDGDAPNQVECSTTVWTWR